MSSFIAIDWGTTNRRIYRFDEGAVIRTERDDCGARAMQGRDYAAEVATVRSRFGDLPVLIAGMAGSTIGWREAPYVSAPAGLAALADGLLEIDERTAIIPGLSYRGEARADVMRGEEVQLLGAVASGMAPPDALLCQPGTHCKWAAMQDGEIATFATVMTGELFALLKSASVLAPNLAGDVADGPAFREGVARGARGDLTAALFSIRAGSLLGTLPATDAASYASGILIGADVAACAATDSTIHLLADPVLGGLYQTAIETLGGGAVLLDSHQAFAAGIIAIKELRS